MFYSKMNLLEKRLRVWVSLLVMIYTAAYGSICLLFPCIPIIFINRKLFHACIDFITSLWFANTVYFLERVTQIKIYLHEHKLNKDFKKSSIVLMNHRTRLDWMFYFCVLYRMNLLCNIKIILKKGLEKIPGIGEQTFGWAMQLALFVFIKRRWEEDKSILSFFIKYFENIDKKITILLFPEGTDLTLTTLGRSDKFAAANDLPCYKKVLHPRTTGFCHIFNEMNSSKILDSVQDVTVAYKGEIPQNELSFAKGQLPDEIHFYIDKFAISDIVDVDKSQEENKSNLESWLIKRWKMKEDFLTKFYEDGFESLEVDYLTQEPNGEKTKFLFSYPIFWLINCSLGAYVVYYFISLKVFLALSLPLFVFLYLMEDKQRILMTKF